MFTVTVLLHGEHASLAVAINTVVVVLHGEHSLGALTTQGRGFSAVMRRTSGGPRKTTVIATVNRAYFWARDMLRAEKQSDKNKKK